MELKEYQSAALEAFSRWLAELGKARVQSEIDAAALPNASPLVRDAILNYPKSAWEALAQVGGVAATAGAYVSRSDEAGRPIPHVCFKVPTGGGKTLLAANALARFGLSTGLVVWITPTRAIYEQTRKALRTREHPYRQTLENASGGRVKILEKDEAFTRADVDNYMCVMLLMLPAANRQKGREFLRMFRDSGRYPTLFPDDDDLLGEQRMLNDHPDLERVSENGPVKRSLFNVFKILRPVVVLDEAHKAYGKKREASEDFVRSVNRLDPRAVVELSATPNRKISNLLVDVTGVDLKNEEMIKLPIEVKSLTGGEWVNALELARGELERLEGEARALERSEGRYIRPIAVVRVERTGRDQRDGERVHAEDVRERLIQNMGVPEAHVAVKSSEMDELAGEDLMSEFSQIRWIITKSALMEGWDCPFAYVLAMLDNTRAQRAITQLVGRVMRQPHARRTGRAALDSCYVYCWNTDVGKAVEQVKSGLEQEGMTGLGDEVIAPSSDMARVTVRRRKAFRGENIYLPVVSHRDGGGGWEELDYHRHILADVRWDEIAAPDPQAGFDDPIQLQYASVDVGDETTSFGEGFDAAIDKSLRVSWFARRLSDTMPNAWQAARIAEDFIGKMRAAERSDDQIYDARSRLAIRLREWVSQSVERESERVFREKLAAGEIRFDLESSEPRFRMWQTYEIPEVSGGTLSRSGGRAMQLNLFEPIYDRHFDSDLERNFARYLDERKALSWWHRVAVRQRGGYYLRGWKRERVFPDFVAMGGETANGVPHLLVFETKGEHLRGNPDTEYKRRVLETLESAFNGEGVRDGGTMTIREGPAKGTFRLVFGDADFVEATAGLEAGYRA